MIHGRQTLICQITDMMKQGMCVFFDLMFVSIFPMAEEKRMEEGQKENSQYFLLYGLPMIFLNIGIRYQKHGN